MQSNSEPISELLSKMKASLIDVLADEPKLPGGSREKIVSCLSMIEIIRVTILKGNGSPTETFLKPIHAGFSRSMESLNCKASDGLSNARSMDALNGKASDGLSNTRSMTNLNEQLGMYDNENNGEHDEINSLNNLKEHYLKVVDDINNSRRINDEIINTKPEINHGSKQEINSSQPEVNGAKTEMTKSSKPEVESGRRRRKRDSSTLFDISLDDLTEPDHSGILEEKHSGKEWWCVLQDQHLCMFPSQNPEELAYDVLLVPCCEISLDDAYTESPVFRLTQVGSTPWVFSAGIERNLRAWIRALCRASGRDDVDGKSFNHSGKSRRNEKKQKKKDMKVFSTTIEEMAEDEEGEEGNEKEEMVNGKEKSETRDDKDDSSDEISSCKHKKLTTQNLLTEEHTVVKRPQVVLNDDNDDYVVAKHDGREMTLLCPTPDGNACLSPRALTRRKSTKKRIKLLRWFKKTLFGDDGQDIAVIGDIYKLEEPNANLTKLWCLLRNRDLYCYRSIADKNVVMVIPLDGCHVVPGAPDGLEHYPEQFLFTIEEHDKSRHIFVAKSYREMERWMEIVKNKRAMVSLGELNDENEGNSENGSPCSSSFSSSDDDDDDDDDDDEGYCYPAGAEIPSRISAFYESEATSGDIVDDGEYISVIDIEEEVLVRRSRKERSFNKADKPETEKESLYINIPVQGNPQLNTIHQKKSRGPAPLPKSAAYIAGKKKEQNRDEIKIAVEEIPSEENNLQSMIPEDTSGDVMFPGDVTYVNGQHSDVEYSDEKKEEPKSVPDSGVVSAANCRGEILKYQLLASSSLQDSPPSQAILGQRSSPEMTGAWRPEVNDKNQFLEIDLGEIISVLSIGIRGRPDHNEYGGEFVKSYTLSHSNTRETWSVYKSRGKAKVFQGNANPENECIKTLKNVIARYIRICPQSWQNHIALRVELCKEQQVNHENNSKVKSNKKKQEKRKSNTHDGEKLLTLPIISTGGLEKKKKTPLLKKNISSPILHNSDGPSRASHDPGSVEEAELFDQVNGSEERLKINGDLPSSIKDGSEVPNTEPQSLESRIKLRENLLTKEKKELIIALEGLKKRANYAKDKKIVLSNSNQYKEDATDTEEEYLTVKLELVKIKKRLTTIETEMRELRLFASQHRETQEEMERPKDFTKPSKPPLQRRASKEIKIAPNIMSPPVDKEAFNPEPQFPPARKVLDNVKIFERLGNQ